MTFTFLKINKELLCKTKKRNVSTKANWYFQSCYNYEIHLSKKVGLTFLTSIIITMVVFFILFPITNVDDLEPSEVVLPQDEGGGNFNFNSLYELSVEDEYEIPVRQRRLGIADMDPLDPYDPYDPVNVLNGYNQGIAQGHPAEEDPQPVAEVIQPPVAEVIQPPVAEVIQPPVAEVIQPPVAEVVLPPDVPEVIDRRPRSRR